MGAGRVRVRRTTFAKILRWATVDCVKAGWLVKNKGRWSITDAGKQAYEAIRDPETFAKRALQLYNQWRKTQRAVEATDANDAEDGAGEKEVTVTFEEAEEHSWSEIASYLHAMAPYDFQELVGSLLRGILALSDPLGTHAPRIKVQVKRQTQAVAVDGLRSFMALLGDDDVGLFVAAGGFTKAAEDEARTHENRRVTLVDLERLFDLWVEFYTKLDDPARRRLPLRPIHFLAPQE